MSDPLLLDEHYPASLARLLRTEGFDVVAISEDPALMGVPDPEVYQAAIDQSRRIVTENVRDFRPLLALALSNDLPYAPVLFTTSKRHPRSDALGRLAADLRAWLEADTPRQPEEWL